MTGTATLSVFKTGDAEARFRAIYDARLRHWPVPFEELDLPTSYGTTHVIASGSPDAPPLFLFAAMMLGATQWRSSAAALSRHFRVYAIDVIGEPNKGRPTRRISDRRGYAEWFSEVLDALKVERASIVGNSYGGFLALSQASLTPERIDRVVLLSPAETLAPIGWKFYAHLLPFMFAMVLSGLQKRAIDSLMTWAANGVPIGPLDENFPELMALVILEGRPANFARPHVFSRAELAAIRTPTLLLIGDKEVIYEPHAAMRRALARMPGLEGAIVPGANHMTAMAQPDVVNSQIIEFLQRKIP